MQAPYLGTLTITTPSGRSAKVTQGSGVSLTDYADPFSILAAGSSVTFNSQSYSTSYDATTRRFTDRTPTGKTVKREIDNLGRLTRFEVPGLQPTSSSYDGHGRISDVTQGSRTWHSAYDSSGNLASVSGPLGQTTRYAYDPVGRVTELTLPDGRRVGYDYDKNGNLTSISPSGRPSSSFGYTATGRLASVALPDVGDGAQPTAYGWNADGALTSITRPDGSSIYFDYDLGRRLSTIAWPSGQTSYEYSETSGNLTGIRGS